jgi:hypothetical protein
MKHHQIRPALRCCALVLPLLCAQNVLAKAQTVQVSATQEARKVVADFRLKPLWSVLRSKTARVRSGITLR